MTTIKFAPDNKEEGLKVIIHAGLVTYTSIKGVYRVPDYVLQILDKRGITYERMSNTKLDDKITNTS